MQAQTAPDYPGIENIPFQRHADDIAANMNRFKGTAPDPAKPLPPVEQFRFDFFSGNWTGIAASLKKMPPELADRVYSKILADLTARREPFMQQEDVIGLIRANPSGWDATRLQHLGQLVKVCISPMELPWLEKQLTEGVGGLGGNDPASRLNAGRMLIHTPFHALATKFLPTADGAKAITDEAVRTQVVAYLDARAQVNEMEKQQGYSELAKHMVVMSDPKASAANLKAAKAAFMKLLPEASQAALESAFTSLIKNKPDVAYELLTELVKKYQDSLRLKNYDLRQQQLLSLNTLARACVATVPADDEKWKTLLSLMADHWLTEADVTYQTKGVVTRLGRLDAVPPQELVISAPSGKWIQALPKSMSNKVLIGVVRANMLAGAFDEAATQLVELHKSDPETALPAAQEFLTHWAERHDPNIPEAIRARHALPQDAYISVTPLMIERNINGLARILTLFRENGVPYGDSAKLVSAFDVVYGRAEAYKLSHIEKVFGPIEQLDESLVMQLLTRMGDSLGKKWRNIEMQKQNLTRRDESQTLELTRNGYTTATTIADRWLAKTPDGFQVATLGGMLSNDWADFEYFQKLDTSDSLARMTAYRQKFVKSQDFFFKAAKAYEKAVPQMVPASYSIDVYVAWFNSQLGINSNGDVNLSKPTSRPGLTKIRDSMRSMSKEATDAHVGMFARYITSRMQATNPGLHEDLKYKYLASSLMITQDNPFTMQARQQVDYYNELLAEMRLQADLDGPTTVGRDQDFGIVLSVYHTEGMGRMARFKRHLSNTLPPDTTNRRAQAARNPMAPKVLRMTEVQGPRDALELSIHEALDPFFDVRSITFSREDVLPRPTDTPGWQQTVLAYVHLRAKDASVDRVPPIELELSFLDFGGPVTIPVESAETLLKVQSDTVPPRPVAGVEVTQTLDARQLPTTGGVTLHIKATAAGLVPELDQILNLDVMKPGIAVKSVAAAGGPLVREINSWSQNIQAISEREWTVTLQAPDEVHEGSASTTFTFPTALAADTKITNQMFDDMNLVPVTSATATIGEVRTDSGVMLKKLIWPVAGVIVLALAGLIAFLMLRGRKEHAPVVHARDIFKMPEHLDGFVVVRLLNGLISSPHVNFANADKDAIRKDIDHVQKSVFTPNGSGLDTSDLKSIVSKWLARLN